MNDSLTLKEGSRISIGNSRKQWMVTRFVHVEIRPRKDHLDVWFIVDIKELQKKFKSKRLRERRLHFFLSQVDEMRAPEFKRKKAVFWINGLKKKEKLSVFQCRADEISSLAA